MAMKCSDLLPKSTVRNCCLSTTPAHQTSLPCSTGYPGPREVDDAVNFTFPLFLITEVQA